MNPGVINPEISPKPPKPWYKKAFRAIAWIATILLLLVLIPVTLLFVYEKEIKKAIIDELNTHLKTKVFIDPNNIDLTIISTFPKAAIVFKDVTIMGALEEQKNDTLLHAKSIYLLFNAKDIWNKNYEIRQIRVLDSKLNLQTNKDGFDNYDIWENDTVETTGKQTRFKLSEVNLERFDFSYKNAQNKVKIAADFDDILLGGNFTEKMYALDVRANGRVDYIRSNKKNLLKNKKITAVVSAQVNDKRYNLTSAEIGLNKLFFTAEGWISDNDTELPTEIRFKGKNIDVQSILSWLPDDVQDKVKDYTSEGIFYSDLDLKGNLQDYNTLDIKANFGTSKCVLRYNPTNTTLNDVRFKGTFTKEKFNTEKLELTDLKARQGNNYVEGDFSLSNFASPYLKLKARGNYELADFFKLVPLDTLKEGKGRIDFDVEGNININDARVKQIGTSSMKGKIDLKEIELAFKNGHTLQVPKGEIVVDNENLETKNLVVIHGKSSLEVSGTGTNFLNYLLKSGQPLQVALEVKSPLIDVDDFIIAGPEKKETQTESGNAFNLKDNITASLKMEVKEVVFRTFKARNLQGTLEIRNQKLMAKNFSFEAFDGDLTLTGVADASKENRIDITGSTNLVDVNIRQMFGQLNNFGQSVIEAKNLNGKATTQIDFSASWNGELRCDPKSIQAAADLNITNGELIDYKMLEVLAEYVDLKELKRVKFATLQTHVDIKNQTVFISKTSVKNSALDLEVSGSQTFDNIIDYRIKLRLSDWLAKRPGKNKQLDEELLESENDPENKRCVFLRMSGTIDKPVITYDRKAMKQKIREDIKEEKNTLKKILNEEFGWFRKDTTLKKDDKKQDQKFQIQFNKKDDKKVKGEKDDGGDF